MLPNRRLSEYLPVRFANGDQVRQFSKPCVHCGQMLNAQHMVGVARLVKGMIAIAAKANCPACGKQFSVTCLIDEDKRVQRVVVPYWLFNPYLRAIQLQDDEQFASSSAAVSDMLPEPEAASEIPPSQLERAEDAVGRYQGKPIPAWVRVNGRLFTFDRVAQNAQAGQGELLLDGCLVYRPGADN
ncbi:hypothetical protein SAMN05660284_02695 [Formivibrio citricus]|uniref:Uncharacterized protein n=1 Tax=Formivibrio citricus TaxID=83765 RepID=A0A1I5DMV6_9NEIS|nr:hypothetical protein [Formivibrio citricus]SFO00121.1 hypothetical protein SAMN05660284_02695 [Formivibrio citricus]